MTLGFSTSPARSTAHLSPEIARRCLDIIVASTAILATGIFMLIAATAILIESGRPILFRQRRIGRDGRAFTMLKFRKFGPDAGTSGCALTVSGDSRMTRVGRFLMKTKMDELPQLWNVLKGDMSIVGPRPESFAFADCFTGGFERVLDYKPGLLGPCQVAFRNEGDLYPLGRDPEEFYREVIFPAKARMDLDYYRNRTLLSDIGWIIGGAMAVLGLVRNSPPDLKSLLKQ